MNPQMPSPGACRAGLTVPWGVQDANVFDSAVDATVELIYSSSAGGSPHAHQAALTPQLVQAVRLALHQA